MGWATEHIAKLQQGQAIQFRPHGHSMRGKIASGNLVTVEPATEEMQFTKGDIVLCKVHGREYLHLVKAVAGQRYQIGNNHGGINGWIRKSKIFGRCTKVET